MQESSSSPMSVHASAHPSMRPSIYLTFITSVYVSFHPSSCALMHSPIHPSVHPSVHPSSIRPSIIHPCTHPSIHPSVHSYSLSYMHVLALSPLVPCANQSRLHEHISREPCLGCSAAFLLPPQILLNFLPLRFLSCPSAAACVSKAICSGIASQALMLTGSGCCMSNSYRGSCL